MVEELQNSPTELHLLSITHTYQLDWALTYFYNVFSFLFFPFLNLTQLRAIGNVRPTDGAVEHEIKTSLFGCSPCLNLTFNRHGSSLKFEQCS